MFASHIRKTIPGQLSTSFSFKTRLKFFFMGRLQNGVAIPSAMEVASQSRQLSIIFFYKQTISRQRQKATAHRSLGLKKLKELKSKKPRRFLVF